MSINATAGSTVPLVLTTTPPNTGQANNLGYRIIAPNGSTVLARQSNPGAAIVEAVASSGVYIAQRVFTAPLIGAIIWDLTPPGNLFAAEDISIVPLTSLPGVVVGGVPVLVTVTDAVTSLPLANVAVQVYLQSDTTFANPLALVFTSTSGQATVFVPPATPITILYFLAGYNTLAVNFTSQTSSQPPLTRTDSLTSAFAAVEPGMVIVFDRIVDAHGQPLKDVPVLVKVNTRPVFVIADSDLVVPDFFETKTDAAGFWQIPLVPNAGLTPSGTYYEFEMGKLEPRVRKAAFVATSPPTQRFRNLASAP